MDPEWTMDPDLICFQSSGKIPDNKEELKIFVKCGVIIFDASFSNLAEMLSGSTALLHFNLFREVKTLLFVMVVKN